MNEIDISDLANDEVSEESIDESENQQQEEEQEDLELSDLRAKKILKLQFYLEEFPDKLAAYRSIPIYELNIEQLDGLQKEFTTVISCQSNVNFAVQTFSQAIIFSETLLCNLTPIKAKGLSSILKDKALIDDVKAWTLENIDIVDTKPEYRIVTKVISSLLILHQFNTQEEAKAKEEEMKRENPEKKEKLEQINNDPKYAQL